MDVTAPLYNSRIIQSYTEYLTAHYPDIDIDRVLQQASIEKYQIEDPAHWFTQNQTDRFQEIIRKITGNSHIAREAGRYVASSKSFVPIKAYILGLITPATAYIFTGKIAGTLTRHATFKTNKISKNKVEVVTVPKPGIKEKPYQCENRMGMLESLVTLYTNKRATIDHENCIHRGDNCCHYVVTWEKNPSLIWKRIRNMLFLLGIITLPLLYFFLSKTTWNGVMLSYAFVSLLISLLAEYGEKKQLITAIATQGDTAQELIRETTLRYNNALCIHELGQAASTILNIDELCLRVADIMKRHLHFDRGIIMLASEERDRLIYKSGYGHSERQEELLCQIDFLLDDSGSTGPLTSIFMQNKARLIDDISEIKKDMSPEDQELADEFNVRSMICVPIVHEREPIGILCVDNVQSQMPLTQSDLNLLMGVASQIAISINNVSSLRKLKENETKYRTIFENTGSATIIVEEDTTISLANAEFEKLTGYSKDELVGKMRWSEFVLKKDLEGATEYHRRRRIYPDSTPSNYELKIIDREGKSKDLFLTSNIIPGSKQSVASLLDITERKRADREIKERQQYLEGVLAAAPDAIITRDCKQMIAEWNPGAEKLFGYSRDEAIGKSLDSLINNPTTYNEAANLTRKVLLERKLVSIETVRYRNDGSPVEVIASGSPIIVENELIGDVAIYSNITDRKRAEKEKKKLEDQLQHSQKMESIGTLAGGIAHDFNNLLMGIQGNASLMLLDIQGKNSHYDRLKNVENYVQKGAELTRQLLGFARGGKYEVKPTDLNELIGKSAEMFGRTKKEITIHRKFQKDIWTVEIDQGQIDQVLLNLYVNAWQAMPVGGTLYIETKNSFLREDDVDPYNVDPGRFVQISFTDTGVGMDESTRQRIFEPFFTTKEMGRGTGLGLASAYGIIVNHGGIITVNSEIGMGTTFIIYLPASDKTRYAEEEAADKMTMGTGTILLVDDEDMILEVGKGLLECLGYRVLTAREGKEAITIYQQTQHEIDMVILDMIMPEMGGGETYDMLKTVNPSINVLLSSGYSMRGQAQGIMQRGCKGFIQKPFTIKDLSQKVGDILAGS